MRQRNLLGQEKALDKVEVGDKFKATAALNADVHESSSNKPPDGNIRNNIKDVTIHTVKFLRQIKVLWPTDGNSAGDLKIIMGEAGWPTDGNINADTKLAQTFHDGLLKEGNPCPTRLLQQHQTLPLASCLDNDRVGDKIKATAALNADVHESSSNKPPDGNIRNNIKDVTIHTVKFLRQIKALWPIDGNSAGDLKIIMGQVGWPPNGNINRLQKQAPQALDLDQLSTPLLPASQASPPPTPIPLPSPLSVSPPPLPSEAEEFTFPVMWG
ncbi:hypothetical protein POTOM_032686 [Populus tomentosa]|uniref:glucan endo-1,3-beta-D-glucosidase n=1 Tax=Populus tomentosa TaxID=118781 RepID=A0A8X7Z4W9_POPTO|nr:hypothetical protein POTOM_032686 [Populus tomentosa]